jgi:hypothetical protein
VPCPGNPDEAKVRIRRDESLTLPRRSEGVPFAPDQERRRRQSSPTLAETVRAAGIRYLERLVAGVPRFRRNPTPEERAADAECSSALEALRAVGALDDREHTEWSQRLLAAQAPWLDEPTPSPGEGPWAISIPPETPEEAAQDAAFEAAWAARPKAETTRRVVNGSPERHAGLAMIALAVHEDATSLHFHFVGEPAPVDAPSPHSKRAFDDALDGLVRRPSATTAAPRTSRWSRAQSPPPRTHTSPIATPG